jgi:YidC/Oxa1 family membrane protein insertase
MEKRAILAAVLMAALLMIYQTFFMPAVPDPPPGSKTVESPPPAAPPAPATPPTATPAPAPRSAEAAPLPPQRLVSVETPLYSAVVSSEGGKFQEFTLKYRGEKPLVILGELGPTGLALATDPGRTPEVVSMSVSADSVRVSPDRPTADLVLSGERDGVRVRETLRFRHDNFAIDADVRVENISGASREVSLLYPWYSRAAWKGTAERFHGQHPTEVVWRTGHVERIEDLTTVIDRTVDGSWIALDSVWYLVALMPRSEGFRLLTLRPPAAGGKNDDPAAARVGVAVRATATIAPGQAWQGQLTVYAGPKEYDRLANAGLEETINFGGFPIPRKWGGLPMDWLGVPILRLMNWVYHYVGNYGIAIILLTVISKVLFYPLTVKSMRSMKAMQTLAPQVNALRSKYKNDPQRLQQETLELYRKHHVNPMGGCLPMVAQIPIFYALYLALSVSVDLQGAPFLCFGRAFGVDLWICDLASQDPTYVLPILMGITMFVQQKLTPAAGDPRQAKMMLVMPFVFTFMFLNLPSGLVLYWTVSNVLQIAQQWYMDRSKGAGAAREAKSAARA